MSKSRASATMKSLVQLSIVNQQRTAERLSTHALGASLGCWEVSKSSHSSQGQPPCHSVSIKFYAASKPKK